MAQHNPQGSAKSATGTRTRIDEPHRYKVIFHNDNVTTMDFVIMVLVTVFRLKPNIATALMLQVHHKGSAVVGTYTYDIAVTRRTKAIAMARDEGFPLNITVEQE